MYLSQSHVHLHDEVQEGFYNYADLSGAKKNPKKTSASKLLTSHMRNISLSEDNITRKLLTKSNLQLTDSQSTSIEFKSGVMFDADTNLLICDVCGLKHVLTVCLQLPEEQVKEKVDIIEKKKKIKYFRKPKKSKLMNEKKSLSTMNIEEFKDCAHTMEVFAASSERKWTMEYFFDKQYDQHKLSKIIIGRGQCDNFPEFNSVHLVEAIFTWKSSIWRHHILDCLYERNSSIMRNYSLLPSNRSCQFCLHDRQSIISTKVSQNLPLGKETSPTKVQAIVASDISSASPHSPVIYELPSKNGDKMVDELKEKENVIDKKNDMKQKNREFLRLFTKIRQKKDEKIIKVLQKDNPIINKNTFDLEEFDII